MYSAISKSHTTKPNIGEPLEWCWGPLACAPGLDGGLDGDGICLPNRFFFRCDSVGTVWNVNWFSMMGCYTVRIVAVGSQLR